LGFGRWPRRWRGKGSLKSLKDFLNLPQGLGHAMVFEFEHEGQQACFLAERFEGYVPINRALIGEEMSVAVAVVVVQVRGHDQVFQQAEDRLDTLGQVRVASIEADAEIAQACLVNEGQKIRRSRELIRDVFERDGYAPLFGKDT
jgi:hypothetical protein